MKHSKWFGGLLGFLGAWGGMGVFATAMDFEISLGSIALYCLVGGLLGIWVSGKRLRFALLPVLVLATLVAWVALGLERSLETLLYYVSRLYMMGYDWPTIRWSGEILVKADAALAFGVWGLWTAYGITRGFGEKNGAWLAVTVAILPLVPCLLLTDTVPEAKWLYLQLFVLVMLLLCSRAPGRGLYLALPVAAALGLLFLCMPQEDYKGQWLAEKMDSWITGEGKQEEEKETHIVIPDLSSKKVNLAMAGPRPSWLIPVMEMQSSQGGTIYLRAMAYDQYTGTSWKLDENEEELPLFSFKNAQQSMNVVTRTVHDNLYLPYGVSTVVTGQSVVKMYPKGRVENEGDSTEYFIQYNTLNPSQARYGVSSQDKILVGYGSMEVYVQAQQRYLQLPETTRKQAQAWLDSHLPATGDDLWDMIEAICDLVSQSARYDLSTQRMPNHKDFALWFLEESDTGYCVHYATAAAVLLRAAGIPARYVTGYMVESVAGHTVTVYQKNAHAWVEVFFNGGWVPFEPTPSGGVEQTQSPTNPPETTAPPETEATTEPEDTGVWDTKPIGGADQPQKPQKPHGSQEKKPLAGWIKSILWTLAAAVAAVSQWQARVAWKRRRRVRPNRQALLLWRDAVWCGRLLGSKPAEEFHQLAQKAKFSQYTMTRQEILRCRELLTQMKQALRKAGFAKNLVATLVLAIY